MTCKTATQDKKSKDIHLISIITRFLCPRKTFVIAEVKSTMILGIDAEIVLCINFLRQMGERITNRKSQDDQTAIQSVVNK